MYRIESGKSLASHKFSPSQFHVTKDYVGPHRGLTLFFLFLSYDKCVWMESRDTIKEAAFRKAEKVFKLLLIMMF